MSKSVFAQRLREARDNRGWTQEQMAIMLGVSSAALSGYERGYREPDLEMLLKITRLLEVSVDYLIGRYDEDPAKNSKEELPQPYIELGKLIHNYKNLRFHGQPLDTEDKERILLALEVAWNFRRKQPKTNPKP